MVGSCDVCFPIRLEGLVLTHQQFSRFAQAASALVFKWHKSSALYNSYYPFIPKAMSQSYFLVWFTAWWNHVLSCWSLCLEKSFLQVRRSEVSLALISPEVFNQIFSIHLLFPSRCQRSLWNLWSFREHLPNPEGIQETVKRKVLFYFSACNISCCHCFFSYSLSLKRMLECMKGLIEPCVVKAHFVVCIHVLVRICKCCHLNEIMKWLWKNFCFVTYLNVFCHVEKKPIKADNLPTGLAYFGKH